MKKSRGLSIALLILGCSILSSAAWLPHAREPQPDASRMTSRQSPGLPAAFMAAMPNYIGIDSTDVCAANGFDGRNNTLKTGPTCSGFPGAGCYACEPLTSQIVRVSGMQGNGGSGFQPQGDGSSSSCDVNELYQGLCRSNFGNYYCEAIVDQNSKCSGQATNFVTQTGSMASLDTNRSVVSELSANGSALSIVVR